MSETQAASIDDTFNEMVPGIETDLSIERSIKLPFGVDILEGSVELSVETDEISPQAAVNTYTVLPCILPVGDKRIKAADTQKDDWR